jgi:hypothetical protein
VTCIVGIEHDGGVVIGGDSAGLSGWSKTVRADEKVFTVGAYVMGFTSSFRMGQLLRYSLVVPAPDTWDVDRHMSTVFVDAVRATLKTGGFAKTSESQEEGGTFLVGVAGRLYAIYDNYQFARSAAGYQAVGCGADIALGSLHTTAELDMAPKLRAEAALEAAAALSGGVAGPFSIIDHAAPSM